VQADQGKSRQRLRQQAAAYFEMLIRPLQLQKHVFAAHQSPRCEPLHAAIIQTKA